MFDLLKFVFGIWVYVFGLVVVVLFLYIPSLIVDWLKGLGNSLLGALGNLEGKIMTRRYLFKGYAWSFVVLIGMGILAVQINVPIPHLFKPENSLFSFMVGLLVGTVGAILSSIQLSIEGAFREDF